MKQKILVHFLVILFFLGSCKKDENEPVAFRGDLVSKDLVTSMTTTSIQTLIGNVQPSLLSEIQVSYSIDLYRVVYKTINPKGIETTASGLLIIPKNANKTLPLANFNHGTILRKSDVPSFLGSGYEAGIMFGTEGYVVALPDFLGLGRGSGLHPYMHAKSEATSVIDMLRASRNACSQLGINLNNQLFLSGYSQGGHVTMATHKMIEEEYSSEFVVTASAPMAGPFDVSGTQFNTILKNEAYPSPGYLPYVFYSYNYVYQLYTDLSSVLLPPYNTTLAPFFNGLNTSSLSDVEAILPSSKIPSAIIKTEILTALNNDQNHPIRVALRDNDLYDWTPKAPIKMCHCDGDKHVPIGNSTKARQTFNQRGFTNVELIIPLAGGDHNTCVIPSLIAANRWFNSLKN